MAETLSNYTLTDLFTSLAGDEINLITGFVWLLIAVTFSMVGGAIGGMLLAGKDIGYQLSAILGGLLAPAGVIPAIILGMLMINFLIMF
ncbi:MAG: hypothetical protein DSM106950_12310 [Stigonema ocellatum SAG 48.90 = DSM 106950]|nr:hypothetical protein [Stigonema ocellatum SAG 48.90 = DSM 106950]